MYRERQEARCSLKGGDSLGGGIRNKMNRRPVQAAARLLRVSFIKAQALCYENAICGWTYGLACHYGANSNRYLRP